MGVIRPAGLVPAYEWRSFFDRANAMGAKPDAPAHVPTKASENLCESRPQLLGMFFAEIYRGVPSSLAITPGIPSGSTG